MANPKPNAIILANRTFAAVTHNYIPPKSPIGTAQSSSKAPSSSASTPTTLPQK